jgi:hypothetical protein
MKTSIALLAALLVCTPALAQDDSPFLEGDTAKSDQPPVALKRPSDSWQFVDVEKLRAQGKVQDGRLKFQLWYGAARAAIFVRAWIGSNPQDQSSPAQEQADRSKRELGQIIRQAKFSKLKGIRVGRRAGVWLEVTGKVPQQRDRTKLRDIMIVQAFCFRPDDNAMLVFSMEFSDTSRAKALVKDFKKLLKKVRF